MRRAALVVVMVLPTAVVLVAVRPVAANPVGYDSVATTALAAGVSTQGYVGASGGLVTVDTGSARVAATLDGSPSAHVIATPYEPGGTFRAVVGQVNPNLPPDRRVAVPGAEASYPGSSRASTPLVPATTAGPVSVAGGSATASAGPHLVTGTATGAALSVAGVLVAGGSATDLRMTVDGASGSVTQSARTSVSRVDVGGVLHLDDVVATARVTAAADRHTAEQSLTVGGASVGGQSVTIGNDGVMAVGTTAVPGRTLADATAQANAVLKAAGIRVRTVGGVARHGARSSDADSGGVLVTVTTPGLPVGGVTGNALTVLVGGVVLTEVDSLPQLSAPGLGTPPVTALVPGGAPGTTTTYVPGTPGTQGLSGAAPTLAGPTAEASYEVVGRRISARTALIAFAVWQLLSLSLPTLYAFVERRRRLALAGGPS